MKTITIILGLLIGFVLVQTYITNKRVTAIEKCIVKLTETDSLQNRIDLQIAKSLTESK